MVRIFEDKAVGNGKKVLNGFCIKGDDLPTGGNIATGSCILELDKTNNKIAAKFYDEAEADWTEIGGASE